MVSFCSLPNRLSNDPLVVGIGAPRLSQSIKPLFNLFPQNGPKIGQNGPKRQKECEYFELSKINFPCLYLEVVSTIPDHSGDV